MADIFTQVGEEQLVDDIEAARTWYVGWGTGAGTAAKGDTTLSTEASETRVSATMAQPAADQSRFTAAIVADGTKTITNAGVLTLITSGVLFLHSDFTGVALVASDQITFEWTVTWS